MNSSQIQSAIAQLVEKDKIFAQLERSFEFLQHADFVNNLDKSEIRTEVDTFKKRLKTMRTLADQYNMQYKYQQIQDAFEKLINQAPAELQRQKNDVVSKLFGPNEKTNEQYLELFDSTLGDNKFLQIESARTAFTSQLDNIHNAIRKMSADLDSHEKQQAEQYKAKLAALHAAWEADADGVERRLKECDKTNQTLQGRTLVLKKHFSEQIATLADRCTKIGQKLKQDLEYFSLSSHINNAINNVMILARKVDTLAAAVSDGQECLERLNATKQIQQSNDQLVKSIYEMIGVQI